MIHYITHLFSRLRFKLLLLVFLAVLPALGLILYASTEQHRQAASEAQKSALQLVRQASLDQERMIQSTAQLLMAIAQLPAIQERNQAKVNEFLRRLLEQNPLYSNIGIITADGTVVYSALALDTPVNYADRPWFKQALKTRQLTFGEYHVGRISGKPVIHLVYPLFDKSGDLQVMVYASLDLTWVSRLAAKIKLPPGATLAIIDHQGTFLVRHPEPEKWVGKTIPEMERITQVLDHGEGTTEALGIDGNIRLYAFTSLKGMPDSLFLRVGLLKRDVFAKTDRLFFKNLLALAVVLILALIAAWLFGSLLIMRGVNALVATTRRLAAGDLSARTGLGSGEGEIQELARSFDNMVDALEQREAQRQTAEAELHEAMQKLQSTVAAVEQRNRDITLLNEMGDLLQSCLTREEACECITRYVPQLFPELAGNLFILNPRKSLLLEAGASWGEMHSSEQVFTADKCWALRRGELHLVKSDSDLQCQHIPPDRHVGYMCVPLSAQGEILGLLYVQTPENSTGECLRGLDQDLAITVAKQVSLALANLNLRESLHNQAIIDPLTNLFNRRYMEETCERELSRAKRRQTPIGVIMVDLDHFKHINDNFGHDAGDLLLVRLASLLKLHIRHEDIPCRYGGEEFLLIMPDINLETANQRAEELRELISQMEVHHLGLSLGKVTASMGVASYPNHGEELEEIIHAADAAMYRAKQQGRNRVVVAESEGRGVAPTSPHGKEGSYEAPH